jgi:hypothetical protein
MPRTNGAEAPLQNLQILRDPWEKPSHAVTARQTSSLNDEFGSTIVHVRDRIYVDLVDRAVQGLDGPQFDL